METFQKKNDLLIFFPTYNEKGNVLSLIERILKLQLQCDILIIDDGSPDGTYKLIQEKYSLNKNIFVINRGSKKGIGTAHLEALKLAKEKNYKCLITMDADFTHQPEDIPKFLSNSKDSDIIVGSRFLFSNSLEDWNIVRKLMTIGGHILTKYFLGLPYDATGFFRLYNLDNIKYDEFSKMQSKNYDFSFESLSRFFYSGYKIKEVPIILPKRTYGSSKMTFINMINSILKIMIFSITIRLRKKK